MPKKKTSTTTTPEGAALAEIARAVGLPFETDYNNLVLTVQRWLARGEEANDEGRKRVEADRARWVAEMWLGIARRSLAIVAECPSCPACAGMAADALDQIDVQVPPKREEDPTAPLPPAEGEPAELLARLERLGGLLLEDLTEQRRAPVYHIRVPRWASHAYGQVNISLAALRHALPQWEALHAEIQAKQLDLGGWPEIPPIALMLWAKELADGRSLLGSTLQHGTPLRHVLPLLSAVQRAVRELELSGEEFAAAAQLGRGLEHALCGHVPGMEPALRARWGTQVDRVWPPPAVREEA